MSGALASNCFLLGPSSVCGSDYNGYPVQLTREYADETSFNNYFNTNIIDIDGASNGFVKDGCVKGQALSDALQRRRFHSTFFCSKIVSDALTAKCPVQTFSSITLPPLGPIMCSGACGQVYSSVQSILQDPAACPGASGGVSSMLSAVSATCNNYASSLPQNSNQCTNGTSIEKSFCGKKWGMSWCWET